MSEKDNGNATVRTVRESNGRIGIEIKCDNGAGEYLQVPLYEIDDLRDALKELFVGGSFVENVTDAPYTLIGGERVTVAMNGKKLSLPKELEESAKPDWAN